MFAINNGVVTYQGVPVDRLSADQTRSLYGRLGNPTLPSSESGYDPQYWEPYEVSDGDGVGTRYRLKPEYAQSWDIDPDSGQPVLKDPMALYRNGEWFRRVGNVRSVGGEGEVRDLNGITYDDDYGYITPMSNVREYSGSVFTPGMMLAAGGMLGAIGAAGGFSGLLGAGSGTGLGSYAGMTTGLDGVTGTLAGESLAGASSGLGAYSGMTTGLDGLSSASLTAGGGAEGIASATQALNGASGTPWYSQLLQNAQSNLSNPMTVARALMGASQLANSFGNRNGGSGSNNVSTSGELNTLLNLSAFNPLGLLANYKPRDIKPVPFMTGTGLL